MDKRKSYVEVGGTADPAKATSVRGLLAGAKKRGKMAKKGQMKKVVIDQVPSGPWVVREGSSRDQKGSSSSVLFTWSSGVSRSWLSRSATVNWKA